MKSFDDMVAMLSEMPEAERKAIEEKVNKETAGMLWLPLPGPQTEAYFCQAEELFYGGSAGGGKTDLACGLSLTAHQNTLILRRRHKDVLPLYSRINDIIDGKGKGNEQIMRWKVQDRVIDFGGCPLERDKENFKGNPHDLIVFDEVADFLESQYIFIKIWNRSVIPSQRCRIVACGNPPTTPEGLWVVRRWAAWLDPAYHNPAKSGEIRWFISDEDEKDIEVDGPGPHLIGGEEIYATSRCFIRAKLSDNKYLAETDYDKTLDNLPKFLRDAYRDGLFKIEFVDDEWQVIPTDWVRQAQDRWTKQAPDGVPMCAIGVDVAQGGSDSTVIAIRHDGWYAPIIKVVGSLTPSGAEVAGLVVANRRDSATVIVDVGGGYGGAAIEHLKINKIKIARYNGAEASHARTKDKTLKFRNKRAEAYWKFREALDPSQPGGSHIALPDDPELVADLTSVKIKQEEITASGIQLESKKDIKARIGRSPDKGDAVIMAYSDGDKISTILSGDWNNHGARHRPQVNLGHQNIKRRR